MRLVQLILAAAFVVSLQAAAQMTLDSDSITGFEVKKASKISVDIETMQIEYIEKGTVVIRSSAPDSDLTLITDMLTFDYADAEGQLPSMIKLNGNVMIESADIKISSKDCEIDLKKNTAHFSGDVQFSMKGEESASASGDVLIVDMTEGKLEISGESTMTVSTSGKK